VGDLLYEEVKAKTALGLEAKVGDRAQNLIWLWSHRTYLELVLAVSA